MPEEDTRPEVDDPVISIGVLARRVGLSVSAVRKYESMGLVIAHRTDSGRRLFSHEDINRVRNIQHLIQDLGLNIEGIRWMQALLPCWELLPCNAETRQRCPAYLDNSRPCWMVKGHPGVPRDDACRRCRAYRFGSLCTEDIKRIVHDQTGSQDTCAAVGKLMDRKRRCRKED